MKLLNFIVVLIFILNSNMIFSQEKTYQDYLNETAVTYPGCENASSKEDCYVDKIREIIISDLNKHSSIINEISSKDTIPIKILAKNNTNGEIEIADIETENPDLKKATEKSLENLPLIQPATSILQGHSVTTSHSFVVLIQKESSKNKIKPIVFKPRFDPSEKPYPDKDKEEQVVLKDCEKENNIDCLYSKIYSFIEENVTQKIKNELKGERFYLEITISDNGELLSENFECSLEDYQDYFQKMFSNLPIEQPAKINGKNKNMTYSIPIEM